MGSAEQSARLRTWPVLELMKDRLKDRLRSIEITISPLRPGNVAPAVEAQHANRRTASVQVMPSRRTNTMVSITCVNPRVLQKLHRIAGPLLVYGEHAKGEFYVPLATAEGTLVASYNRGMKTLYEAGGVRTTVIDNAMQRAPAFVFERAREARAFGEWLYRALRRDQAGRGDHHAVGQVARHRAVLGQPHPLHALQLHHRRRRRAEPHRQGHRGGLCLDHLQLRGHRSGSISSPTSQRTRRARR